jgi:predicted  nucleic acid-binding Zn-ribbon protein
MQEPSKESKTMQAARDEMKRRIGTLERHIEHCDAERRELLTQIAGLDQQIEEDKKLADDYREVLRRLNVTVTYQSAS